MQDDDCSVIARLRAGVREHGLVDPGRDRLGVHVPPPGQEGYEPGLAEHLGSDTFLKVEVEGIGPLNIRVGGEVELHHGDPVRLAPRPDRIYRFDEAGNAAA